MSLPTLSRVSVGVLALGLVTVILALDLSRSGAPDLFTAPPALALGSGQAPTGAHCTAQ
ncbi:MAG: hypothetical protein GVY34_09945 [Alphaproteobacteria bacterium]|jgi:hypothetical protein|nr:hypothetical protein [Alphaproteobacteria bacterium]